MKPRLQHAPATFALALLCLTFAVAPVTAAAALRVVYDAPAATLPRGKAEAIVPPAPPEYRIEDLGWIEFAYHPSTRERVRPLIARAAAIRADLGALLGREALTAPVQVRIAALPAELDNLAPVELSSTTTAAAFGGLRLAVMSAAPRLAVDPSDLEDTFRHELAHLALDDATEGAALPRWLHEGFAVHAAREHTALRAQTLCAASLRTRLIPLKDVEANLPGAGAQTSIAYAQGADFVRFLLDGSRALGFAGAIDQLRAGATLNDALAKAYGSSASELEIAWRADVARRYGFLPVLTGSLLSVGLVLLTGAAIQRFRSRKPHPALPRRRLRADVQARSRPGRPGAAQIVAARSTRPRGDNDIDVGVPKVEHNGRWHTLH